MPKVKNPHVFMDISISGGSAERITFELLANVVPKTAENFRALCTGESGLGASTQKPLYYKGTHIHRIVKGFVVQGGDFSRGDGKGGESIYGGKFPDENFRLLHNQPGVLSMANSGPDTNGSQFFITFKALPHLDGKHVVFGKVVSGIALLKKLEAVGSETGNPSYQVKIVDCGEVSNTNSQDPLKGDKVSSKTDNSSSDSEKGGHRTKRSLTKGFNAAVAGCFFAIETVLRPLKAENSPPFTTAMIILASVISSTVSNVLLGARPAFIVPAYELKSAAGWNGCYTSFSLFSPIDFSTASL